MVRNPQSAKRKLACKYTDTTVHSPIVCGLGVVGEYFIGRVFSSLANVEQIFIPITYISYPVPPWLWWESWQCWTFHRTLWLSFYSISLEERSPLVNLKFAKKKGAVNRARNNGWSTDNVRTDCGFDRSNFRRAGHVDPSKFNRIENEINLRFLLFSCYLSSHFFFF